MNPNAKVLSVQVGEPKEIEYNGRIVTTSIFKHSVDGPVNVLKLGIDSDTQSDLTVHGGPFKAVYAYPSEHFSWWSDKLPQYEFSEGAFGENLTTQGVLETEIAIGDVVRIGTVMMRVSQPRLPCFKLGIKFNDRMMVSHFHSSLRSGFYFEVLEEGKFERGDIIHLIEKAGSTSIHEFVSLYVDKSPSKERIEAILKDPYLLDKWKLYFNQRLEQSS